MGFNSGFKGLKNRHNSITIENRTHTYINIFDHKDLGPRILQQCLQVMNHPVYPVYPFLVSVIFLMMA